MAETFVTLYQGNGGRVDIGYTLSQSIENNQTTITATAYAVKTNSSYYSYRSSPQNFTLTINGNAKVYGWTFNFGNMNLNQRYAITSHAVTINHNPDGSLGSISTSVYCATGTDGLGTINGSTAIAIPTIPRASSISSISGGTLGSPVTVNISRASASFTHTVVYRRTDGVDVNVGSDQATSCVFTPSINDSAFLPNTTSGIATIFVHTYIGGSYVGTASQSFTVYVPSSVVPVINSVSKSEAVAGIATKFGAYVQNKSQLAINIGAVGAQGSTITSWSTTILGIVYSGASFTSGLLTSVGTVSVSTTVWDTRGRSTTTSSNITVVAYTSPSIVGFSGFRSTSGGVQDITNGTYLRSAMNFAIAPVNVGGVDKNSKSYTVEYKLQSSGTWLPITSGAVFSYNSAFTSASGILSTNSAYDIRLTVTDYFISVTATFQVGTAFALMDWHTSGTSMAIGKVAEGNGVLEIGGDFYINGGRMNNGIRGFEKSFTVGGSANTYYPVLINLNNNISDYVKFSISRQYNEPAPDTWNTATHRGSLNLTILWNGFGTWSGQPAEPYVLVHNENYATICGGINVPVGGGLVVYLRGGGAVYHLSSDLLEGVTATVVLGTWIASDSTQYPAIAYSSAMVQNTVLSRKLATFTSVYPVGAIYMSVVATSPATLFGGTWVALGGRFLIGVDGTYTNGATGGSATVVLTAGQLAPHKHVTPANLVNASGNGTAFTTGSGTAYGLGYGMPYNTTDSGGGEAHPNMPPYLAVYMWKRTA
ncbi:MAG: DUF859 family phage minor structural protein [Clostridiaceae bacterium]